MLKQRMLSAMLIALAVINCTTQTMLVSADEKNNQLKTIVGFNPEVTCKEFSKIRYLTKTKTVNGVSGEKKIKKGTRVKETMRYSNGLSWITYEDDEYLIKTKLLCKNRWNISLTKDERELLAKIVFLEANIEPEKGQRAVVEVIFNRMINEDEFGNDLKSVLSQRGQFTTWKLLHKANPQKSNYEVIDKVLAGKSNILTNDYLYFSMGGHMRHSGMVKIGNHQFCMR